MGRQWNKCSQQSSKSVRSCVKKKIFFKYSDSFYEAVGTIVGSFCRAKSPSHCACPQIPAYNREHSDDNHTFFYPEFPKSVLIACGGRPIRFNTNAKLQLKCTPFIQPSISRRAQPCREASNNFPLWAGGWVGLSEEGVKGALCSAVDLDGTQRRLQSSLSDPLSRGRRATSANSASFSAVERWPRGERERERETARESNNVTFIIHQARGDGDEIRITATIMVVIQYFCYNHVSIHVQVHVSIIKRQEKSSFALSSCGLLWKECREGKKK